MARDSYGGYGRASLRTEIPSDKNTTDVHEAYKRKPSIKTPAFKQGMILQRGFRDALL